jgi:ribonuclease E
MTEKTKKKKTTGKKEAAKQLKIIVNMTAPEETRVALIENGRLKAFDIETEAHTQTAGNIYKGKLQNIEHSLQAAFVDIGLKKNAYLPINEIHPEYHGYARDKKRITDFLQKGQEILVQIIKEETVIKGAFVSTYISLPGRFFVLMPGSSQNGVSRKIEDEKERKRLKEILKSCKVPDGVGIIARTACQGVAKTALLKDLRYLIRLWNTLKKKIAAAPAPSLVFKDSDIAIRFIRDHLTTDVKEIIVDTPEGRDKVKAFLRIIAPRQVAAIKLHTGDKPIFDKFGLESQITEVFQRKVNLPSGGHIVIEPTEALVSIDVNSGKNISEKDIENTALVTNLEAAEEIARQLGLRDLGGIIVIDFIDMRNRANRKKLEKVMREHLKNDKARTEIAMISKFGLMQMVRQKLKAPIRTGSHTECPCCRGRGVIKSVETLSVSYIRQILGRLAGGRKKKLGEIQLHVPPLVASYLGNRKRLELCRIEEDYDISINIITDPDKAPEEHHFEFIPRSAHNGGRNGKKKKQ